MQLELLKELGISDGEIKVYSAILNIGISSINKIHEKTGMERRNIYDILNKLIEKGFVSYNIEKGKKIYQCSSPKVLLERIKNKEEKLKELEKQMPEISAVYENSKPSIMAQIYRGKDGIRTVFEDMLNYKENYFIGGGHYIIKLLPHYWANYNQRRINLKVKWVNLWRDELRKEANPLLLEDIKILPKEFSGYPNVVFIYGNKTANVLWSEDFFAFVIESKEIADNYKKYHRYLWDNIAIGL